MTFPTPPTPTPPPILTSTTPLSLQTATANGGTCNITDAENTLLTIFDQLITDSNSILQSRYQMQVDNAFWTFYNQEIGALVNLANVRGENPTERSLIYGQIMLIITSQYLPAVSTFIGDQIAEQAAIQNMSSDISAFIIQAETGFNTLSSVPDCNCTEDCTTDSCTNSCTVNQDCTNNYNFYSGIMALISENASYATPSSSSVSYSFSVSIAGNPNPFPELNILDFLTDVDLWSGNVPLSTSQSSQISTALLGIAYIFNPAAETDTVEPNTWTSMNLSGIASSICTWTQPYGSTSGGNDPTGAIATGNAPLVYTEPATIQSDLNTAAQTVEGIATSTQTIENFQVQEIDQFYGITNSIQMSQEQQCASMVKQQTA